MKRIHSIAFVSFIGASLLWASTRRSVAQPISMRAAQTVRTEKTPKQTSLRSAVLTPRPGTTKVEASPMFQVSADPKDQVRLLITNDIVTVEGSVGNEALARKLLADYAKIPGVRGVRNRLTVRPNRDSEIAVQLREALSTDPVTHVGAIGVTVYGGIVFLSGSVSSQDEVDRAEELARGVQGVKRVSNGLRLATTPRYPVRQIKPRR